MGILIDLVEKHNELKKRNLSDVFKENSLFFYKKYQQSDQWVRFTPLREISFGGFYFFFYKDESNWMQYSPVFTVEFKKFENKIIILALNFNFIPLEYRAGIFDPFISENDIEKNRDLVVDYKGIYTQLLTIGYEYSLVEYNLSQMVSAFSIDNQLLPRFLISGFPSNKYDPEKLYKIWLEKIKTKKLRDQEIKKLKIDELYKSAQTKREELELLEEKRNRILRNTEKFG